MIRLKYIILQFIAYLPHLFFVLVFCLLLDDRVFFYGSILSPCWLISYNAFFCYSEVALGFIVHILDLSRLPSRDHFMSSIRLLRQYSSFSPLPTLCVWKRKGLPVHKPTLD